MIAIMSLGSSSPARGDYGWMEASDDLAPLAAITCHTIEPCSATPISTAPSWCKPRPPLLKPFSFSIFRRPCAHRRGGRLDGRL